MQNFTAAGRFDLNPQADLPDRLAKAENFAVTLRKKKKQQLLSKKREQLILEVTKQFSKASSGLTPETLSMAPKSATTKAATDRDLDFNLHDLMSLLESGVDFESALQVLAEKLKVEQSVLDYLQSTSQIEVNKVIDWLVNLLPQIPDKSPALTILINLTCLSANVCIFLANICPGAIQKIIDCLQSSPEEVCWLLNHILADNKIHSRDGQVEVQFLHSLNEVCSRQNIETSYVKTTVILVLRNLAINISSCQIEEIRHELAKLSFKFMPNLASGHIDEETILILQEAAKRQLIENVGSIEHLLFNQKNQIVLPVASIMVNLRQRLQSTSKIEKTWLQNEQNGKHDFKFDAEALKVLAFCCESTQVLQSETITQNLHRCLSLAGHTAAQQQATACAMQVVYNHFKISPQFMTDFVLQSCFVQQLIVLISDRQRQYLPKAALMQALEIIKLALCQLTESSSADKSFYRQLVEGVQDFQTAEMVNDEVCELVSQILDQINSSEVSNQVAGDDQAMDCEMIKI